MKTIVRLDKYLADMGVGTRSEVKEKVRKGRVEVNGQVVRQADVKVDTNSDIICFDGERVGYVHYEYYMLHKPAGVISATEDKHATTVIDLIDSKKRKDLFPVGRLDKDTEGLLLITNDGDLTHQLLSPKKHVSKIYYAKINGRVTKKDVAMFSKGLVVDETLTAMPANLTIIKSAEESEVLLEIQEGKFHQVKRMFEAVGKEVTYLKRMTMGPLTLDESLEKGAYRELTEDEIFALKNVGSISATLSLPKDVKAVIFDLDGTLIDSMWLWKQVDIDYLARFGHEMPDNLQEEIAGISVTQTAHYFQNRFGITDSVEKMIDDWNEMAWDKYSQEVALKRGALEFLKLLKKNHIACAIATSNTKALTQMVLKATQIEDYFDCILTGEDVHKGKPDPDIYIEVSKRLGINPAQCLVFEDIPYGIMAAKAAGMMCYGIEDDYSSNDYEEKTRLSDGYINDYFDLIKR